MKLQKFIIALAGSSILAGNGMFAFAGDEKPGHKPFEGIIVENVVAIEQLPEEVQLGSIKTAVDSEQAMADLAKIKAQFAIDIAMMAFPGKVVEVQLSEENGYLVWNVTEVANDGKEIQLMVDAGNGRLLAAESGEQSQAGNDNDDHGSLLKHFNRKHSKWEFWEDRDNKD